MSAPDRGEPRKVARATSGATELALGYFNYLAVVLLRVDLFYVSINLRIAPVKEIAEWE